jgi:hypothetical protein
MCPDISSTTKSRLAPRARGAPTAVRWHEALGRIRSPSHDKQDGQVGSGSYVIGEAEARPPCRHSRVGDHGVVHQAEDTVEC